MTKTLKTRILLTSVSTLLSPIVALKSGFDYLLECFLSSTFARITSVLPENFSNWGGCSHPRPPGSYAYAAENDMKIQLFRQRSSHKIQAYATMPIDSNSVTLLDLGSRRFRARRKGKHAGLCCFFFFFFFPYHAEINISTHNTFRHRRRTLIRLYAFVGQPFSKQLYD